MIIGRAAEILSYLFYDSLRQGHFHEPGELVLVLGKPSDVLCVAAMRETTATDT
jgi:hypothetical protein